LKQQVRSKIASGLDRLGLLLPVEKLRESMLVMRARGGPTADPEGLPIPPARLRLLVTSRSADAGSYLAVGGQMASSIRGAVAAAGNPIEEMEAILDFGCGSGRVARYWAGLEGPRVHGTDYNPELVAWCEANLPFVEAGRNQLEPPAAYESESFDLIYALSVLSHLGEPAQHAWVAEFHRLLRPGGLLIFSVLGHACRYRLTDEEKRRFDDGELVVERPRMEGRNLCTAYHPRSYVTEHLLPDFASVDSFDLGSPDEVLLQDAYIARRAPA
jgi:SAM-dependent methyltransferase